MDFWFKTKFIINLTNWSTSWKKPIKEVVIRLWNETCKNEKRKRGFEKSIIFEFKRELLHWLTEKKKEFELTSLKRSCRNWMSSKTFKN